MGKRALVAGATGLVGSHLLAELCDSEDYCQVTLLVRRLIEHTNPKLKQIVCDFDRLEEYTTTFESVDHVFCALGSTIKQAGSQDAFRRVDLEYPLRLAKLSSTCGVKQFVLVSAMGADETSRIFYNRVKGEVERVVSEVNLPATHILRPSLLLGERKEVRFGEKLASLLMRPTAFLLVGSLEKYRPIYAREVARAMVRVTKTNERGSHVYLSDAISKLSREG